MRWRRRTVTTPAREGDGYTLFVDQNQVTSGSKSYSDMLQKEKLKITRRRTTAMNRETLINNLNDFKREYLIVDGEFPVFCGYITDIAGGKELVESDKLEGVEWSPNRTKCLCYHVKRYSSDSTYKYNMVICYLKANTEVSENVFIGGMVNEGYATVNRANQLCFV